MAKFILHGGNLGNDSLDNMNFYSRIVKDLPDKAIILGIYFAREENEIIDLFPQDEKRLKQATKENNIQYIKANKDKTKLIEQIKMAHAIFLSGGNELWLIENLKDIDFDKLTKNKIVAGSSAGCNIFSRYYYTNDRDCIEKGLNILPIKTFCHYTDSKTEKLKKLEAFQEDLKTYAINEEKYYVIDV